MEIYFNELSLDSVIAIENLNISQLKDIYKHLIEKHISSCRISRESFAQLIQLTSTSTYVQNIAKGFLFSFFRAPYESSVVEENQDEYLSHNWTYQSKNCYGLALSYINDSMALSIGIEEWNKPELSILKDTENINCRNLYGEDTWQYHLNWLEGLEPIVLKECPINPVDKRISLRDDHGKDILQEFSERIVKSKYVCEVVNSCPYTEKRAFIRKVRQDGIIEITLPWTDKGLGIVIRTTGRNLRETKRIADLLKEKYGRQ